MCLAIIRPAVAARGDRYRSLADRKRSIYRIYCELISDISSADVFNHIFSRNVIRIISRVFFLRTVCGIAADCIVDSINRKSVGLYTGSAMCSSIIGKCSGICF